MIKHLLKFITNGVVHVIEWGGSTKRGIDCSAFMQTAFLDAYGVELPRTTSEQRYLGRQIQKHELRKGDLVFFRRNNHVGVYIGNNQFMHASSSQGVTISSLDEDYWARNLHTITSSDVITIFLFQQKSAVKINRTFSLRDYLFIGLSRKFH